MRPAYSEEQIETFKKRLKYEKKTSGLLWKEIAQDVGVSYPTVDRWAHGDSMPKTKDLKRLASYFCLSVTDLLGSPAKVMCYAYKRAVKETIIGTREQIVEKTGIKGKFFTNAVRAGRGVEIGLITLEESERLEPEKDDMRVRYTDEQRVFFKKTFRELLFKSGKSLQAIENELGYELIQLYHWREGNAMPSLYALEDIGMYFHKSILDLLGSPLKEVIYKLELKGNTLTGSYDVIQSLTGLSDEAMETYLKNGNLQAVNTREVTEWGN